MGVRFQETIQLSQKEKELLKKGKLPEGRYSERRSERSDAPEPLDNPEVEEIPDNTNENTNDNAEEPLTQPENDDTTGEATGDGGGDGRPPPRI